MIKRIPLKNLLLDKELQVRPVDQEHVERLVHSDASQWPDLKVIEQTDSTGKETEKFYIVAGQHRYLAAREKKVAGLDCEVIEEYTDDTDLQIEGYADNMRHGLPLSMQQRKDYAVLLKKKHPTLSNAEISRRAGISDHTVAKAFTGITPVAIKRPIASSMATTVIPATPGFTSAQAKTVAAFIDGLLDSDIYDLCDSFSSRTFGDIVARRIMQHYAEEHYEAIVATFKIVGYALVHASKQLK